jgi:hypothetical protein
MIMHDPRERQRDIPIIVSKHISIIQILEYIGIDQSNFRKSSIDDSGIKSGYPNN